MRAWHGPNGCGRTPGRKLWPAAVPVSETVGVGAGAGDHGWVQVEAGHRQAVVAGQPDRQVAGSAPDPKDPGAGGGDGRAGQDHEVPRSDHHTSMRLRYEQCSLPVLVALPISGHAAGLVDGQGCGHKQEQEGGGGVQCRGWVAQPA
jgi:hypothetical protein